mgnify:CR=1 FL=1
MLCSSVLICYIKLQGTPLEFNSGLHSVQVKKPFTLLLPYLNSCKRLLKQLTAFWSQGVEKKIQMAGKKESKAKKQQQATS